MGFVRFFYGLGKTGFSEKYGFVWDFLWDSYGIFMGFLFFSHALALPQAFQQRKAGTQLDCTSSELVLYDIAVERPKVFGHKHVLRNMFGLDCASHRIEVVRNLWVLEESAT